MSNNNETALDRQIASITDYKKTFSSAHGKRVLRHLLRGCGMMIPSMNMNSPSGLAMAFNEGKRAVAIEILEKMRIDLGQLEKEITKQPEDNDVQI